MENLEIINENEEQKKHSKIKSLVCFILRIVIAGGIIWWLVSLHYEDFVKVLNNIDPLWLIIAACFNVIVYLASAFRWLLLLKVQKIKISFYEAFSLTMQGVFFSLVIPGGSIGGDIVKTGFLLSRTPKGRKLEATSTIFMDRFLGMFGQFTIGIVMAIFCIPLIRRMDYAIEVTILMIILVSIVGLVAGVTIMFYRDLEKIRLFSWCMKLGNRITKGYLERLAIILDVYKNSYKTLYKCILVGTVFIQLNMALILFFIAKGIHAVNIPIKPLILAVSLGNTAGLLPITPSGIGTRDAVVNATLHAGGFMQGDSLAIPLLFSAFIILFSVFGGIFFVFKRSGKNGK